MNRFVVGFGISTFGALVGFGIVLTDILGRPEGSVLAGDAALLVFLWANFAVNMMALDWALGVRKENV